MLSLAVVIATWRRLHIVIPPYCILLLRTHTNNILVMSLLVIVIVGLVILVVAVVLSRLRFVELLSSVAMRLSSYGCVQHRRPMHPQFIC